MVLKRQLTCTGHVVRMKDDHLPKALFYGELRKAKYNVGRPCLRNVDYKKRPLGTATIDVKQWEEMAHYQGTWHAAIRQGSTDAESTAADQQTPRHVYVVHY